MIKIQKEAKYYKSREGIALCELCPHNCKLKPGQTGICRARRNEDGILYTLNYAMATALALDPIEKKPLYHFYPGKNILSVGTFGCNLACSFCQNHNIAHEVNTGRSLLPAQLVEIAHQAKADNSIGVAFTYNEPTIWYEYILETAGLLKEADMKVVLVTNGFINLEPLAELLPFVDAMNIDLKAFQEEFYRKNCKAKLEPVKKVIAQAAEQVHLEITTLIIPGENDGADEINELVDFIATLNPDIPLHISRYRPAYKFTKDATPVKTMERAYEIARKHLHFVYMGNMEGITNDTMCKNCGAILIKRNSYQIEVKALAEHSCVNCGAYIDYVVS